MDATGKVEAMDIDSEQQLGSAGAPWCLLNEQGAYLLEQKAEYPLR